MILKEKDIAPDFNLPDEEGKMHSLTSYRGKKVLLYFYPKDDTPGCTTEACMIRDNFSDFQKLGIVVLGVSADDGKKHLKFKAKYNLPFPLLSDIEHTVCEAYNVWQKKKFMGREYMGIARSSFLIDEGGKLLKIYSEVKPAIHAGEVLEDVSLLK